MRNKPAPAHVPIFRTARRSPFLVFSSARAKGGFGLSRYSLAMCALLMFSLAANASESTAESRGNNGTSQPVLVGVIDFLWGPTEDGVSLRDTLQKKAVANNRSYIFGQISAEGQADRLAGMVKSLEQNGANVLYVSGEEALRGVLRARPSIPVVFTVWRAPDDLPELLSKSSTRIAGVTNRFAGVHPQSLDFFKRLVPGVKKVLLPHDASDTRLPPLLKALHQSARKLGVRLISTPVHTTSQARRAITMAEDVDGILPVGGRHNISGYALETTMKRNIPALFPRAWMVDYGGLASYGPGWAELGRLSAPLVEAAAEGNKHHQNKPLENHRMERVINLETAKALGLKLSQSVLDGAQRLVGQSAP